MRKVIPATVCNNCGACNGFVNEYAAEIEIEKNPYCNECGGTLRLYEISEEENKIGYTQP